MPGSSTRWRTGRPTVSPSGCATALAPFVLTSASPNLYRWAVREGGGVVLPSFAATADELGRPSRHDLGAASGATCGSHLREPPCTLFQALPGIFRQSFSSSSAWTDSGSWCDSVAVFALQARGHWFDPSCAHEETPGQSTYRSSSRLPPESSREPPVQARVPRRGAGQAQHLLRSQRAGRRHAVNAWLRGCPARVIREKSFAVTNGDQL